MKRFFIQFWHEFSKGLRSNPRDIALLGAMGWVFPVMQGLSDPPWLAIPPLVWCLLAAAAFWRN